MSNASEHTFIETDSVRYVYQSNSETLLVMITNKLSTLVQDIETLRLVQRVLTDECGGLDKQSLTEHVFEAITALDEIINLGYQESVSHDQIKTYLEMDSHEEYLHNLMQQAKMNAAKQQARTKAAEIAKSKQQQHFTSTTQMESFSSSQLNQQHHQHDSSSSTTTPSFANSSANSFSSSSFKYDSVGSPSSSAGTTTTATKTASIPSFESGSKSDSRKVTFSSSRPTQTVPSNPVLGGNQAAPQRKARGFKTGLSLNKQIRNTPTTTFESGLE